MANPTRVSVDVHMLVSLDGKTTGQFFRATHFFDFVKEYYRIDKEVFNPVSPVCLSGRKCMDGHVEMELPANFPASDRAPGDRSDFHADLATYQLPAHRHFHCIMDPHGRLGWKESIINSDSFAFYNGDRVVEVLVEDWVTDNFLAQLRKVNVPYIFAGKSALDCRLAVDKLGALFKTDRVVCHGGGTINGALLAQGVVDRLSLILVPVVSGEPTDVQLFNAMDGGKLPVTDLDLDSVEKLADGGQWLRYTKKA